VQAFCSCGAQLPPDARFCHKCGKPQGELSAAEASEPTPPPVTPPVAAAADQGTPGIGFRNPIAVRVAFLAGAATSLVIVLPLPAIVQLLWQIMMLLCGGFLAVYLYNRRTGTYVNTRSGAYLGWLAGLFCFLIMLVMFTISVLAISAGGGLQQSFHEMIATRGNAQVASQFDELLRSPAGVAILLFGMLITSFLLVTVVPTIGGALGAKVLDKE
jgi:hypothetical protein